MPRNLVRHPIDVQVGAQIRARRNIVGMSQEKLGAALDLTFQQIQKYESGANRVSASKLHSMSHLLDVPISYFFEGLDGAQPSGRAEAHPVSATIEVIEFLRSDEGLALNRSFAAINDKSTRLSVIGLVRTLAARSG